MSDLINMSICVSDIAKSKIKQAENGKKYMNITVAKRREADSYGNTHTVFMSQRKSVRPKRIAFTSVSERVLASTRQPTHRNQWIRCPLHQRLTTCHFRPCCTI